MINKIKNIISKTDQFLFKKFGSDKSTKSLENIKEAQIIFSYLNETGKDQQVRFVGGCVRKALSGEKIDDIDLATSLEPSDVKKKLIKNNVKVIDTGISHGTVTAILNEKKFEITTLRKDISTDGRHAKVNFTTNWEEDARRRDFTINAIYADIQGRIFDPLDGISDLQAGKIKFIGLVKDRVQEDYLRILRYFRFFINYSRIESDEVTIQSIKQNINGLNQISKERIFDELKKIINTQNIERIFSNNQLREVFLNIFPQFKFYKRLKKFNKLKLKIKEKYSYDLILSLLIIDQTDNYDFFCYKYKTSNKIKEKFKYISNYYEDIKNKKFYTKQNIKKLIYFIGKDFVRDILLFSICAENKIDELTLENNLSYINTYVVPKLPISGEDLKSYGYETGEELGKKLKLLEKKWVENDFVFDKNFV
jgi:poly(A) polymerase